MEMNFLCIERQEGGTMGRGLIVYGKTRLAGNGRPLKVDNELNGV